MRILKIHSGRLWQIILILIWAICSFSFLQLKYPYHFYYQEQEQLFLMDWEYIRGYMSWTDWGWFARLAGDFLTQFYYYMYLGAVILALMLLIVGDMARRAAESVIGLFVEKENAVCSWVAFGVGVSAMSVCLLLSFDVTFRLSNLVSIIGLCCGVWLVAWLFGKFETESQMASFYRRPIAKGLGMIACVPFLFLFLPQKGEFRAKMCAPDYKFERVLAFDNEYYFGHYDKVIEMGRANEDNLIEEESFFYCMALAQKGMLADMLPKMKRPNLGTFYEIGPETPRFVIRMIDELYYLIGDMTYTERAALLANTFSANGRSARKIKRLAEANLINGDIPAAMKYLRLLEKTIAYKRWAVAHMPETMAEAVKADIAGKQQFVNTSDHIRIGDDCYTILTQLLESNPLNSIALDYLLCSDMLSHQRETFVLDYEKYGPSERGIFREIYEGAKLRTIPDPSRYGGE